jgi:hypothetical protein
MKHPEGDSDLCNCECCRPSGASDSEIDDSLELAPKALRFRRSAAELCNFKTRQRGTGENGVNCCCFLAHASGYLRDYAAKNLK